MKPIYLLTTPLLAFTTDTWQPFAIDKQVSVELPAQPAEANLAKLAPGRQMGRTRMWLLQAPEGTYQIMRLPNSERIQAQDNAGRNAYYQGVLTSVLRNERGTLLATTVFPTSAGPGVELEYKAIHRGTGKRVVKFVRYLLADSVSYSLNFASADKSDTLGLAGAEQRRRFFNSITVKP